MTVQTVLSARIFVRYTAPPVTQGDIKFAEVFIKEGKAKYVLEKDLNPGETVLVAAPHIPILISTVRFFEKYNIKNRITIQIDSSREIKEENEKNNQYRKWYYMQQWSEPEEDALEPV